MFLSTNLRIIPPKSFAIWRAASAGSFSIWFSHNITLAAEIVVLADMISFTVRSALAPLTVITLFFPLGKTVSWPTPVNASSVKVMWVVSTPSLFIVFKCSSPKESFPNFMGVRQNQIFVMENVFLTDKMKIYLSNHTCLGTQTSSSNTLICSFTTTT